MGGVKFDRDHNAMVLISTKNLKKDKLMEIRRDVIELLTQHKIGDFFFGGCFGRYDLVVEFLHSSAKIASQIACLIQKKVANLVKEYAKDMKVNAKINASLILSNKIVAVSKKNSGKQSGQIKQIEKTNTFKGVIRAHTFLKTINQDLNFGKILNNLPTNQSIYWNASTFNIILTTFGDNYLNIFDQIEEFRKNQESNFSESFTIFTVKCKAGVSDVENKANQIPAMTHIKIAGEPKIIIGSEWRKIECGTPFSRIGNFDISLCTRQPSLAKLRDAVIELEDKNFGKIIHAATILMKPYKG